MKVVFDPRAVEDLEHDFIAADSPVSADAVVDQVEDERGLLTVVAVFQAPETATTNENGRTASRPKWHA